MEQAIRVAARTGLFCLLLFVAFQGQPLRAQGGGGGGAKQGTVTSITEAAGGGIDLTPNTITTTGSVGIATGGVTNNMLFGGIDPLKITVGGSPFLHAFGTFNTFVGTGAGNFTMGGQRNAALGTSALFNNSSGNDNTAIGHEALTSNTGGYDNTAVGKGALQFNTTGVGNTALGWLALGSSNGVDATGNVAVGANALAFSNGSSNIGIGTAAGFNLHGEHNYNIYIGNRGAANDDNTIRIGTSAFQSSTFIAGISGVTTGGAATAVVVDANGQLGTVSSSKRFKYDIHDMDEATRMMLQLRPVIFRYKQAQNDGSHPLQYGLIAEEVAEVYPELVQRSAEGEPNAVLYQFLPAMLLNEFQKQHRQIEAQQERIRSLEGQLQQLAAETRQLQTQMAAFQAQGERGKQLALVSSGR